MTVSYFIFRAAFALRFRYFAKVRRDLLDKTIFTWHNLPSKLMKHILSKL
jgi:hypothetical protein